MSNIVIDLETTGVDITKDDPVQICAIAYDDNMKETGRFVEYINIGKPIPESATKIHGITDKMLKEKGIAPQKVASDLKWFIWNNKPVHLLGYNILSYDYPLLMNWFHRTGTDKFRLPVFWKITDVLREVSLNLKTNKWPKLSAAAESFGIEYEEGSLHNAVTDVEITAKLWRCLDQTQACKVK